MYGHTSTHDLCVEAHKHTRVRTQKGMRACDRGLLIIASSLGLANSDHFQSSLYLLEYTGCSF